MKKLVIFDLDGTLINTLEDLAAATNHALAGCGFPERALNEYNLLVGRGITNLFRGAVPRGEDSPANIAKMREQFLSYYEGHIHDYSRPYEGIPELIRALHEAGVRLAVASNKYQKGAERLIRYFFKDSFSVILGQQEGFPIKPDPDIVFKAMEMTGITDKKEVAYAGDSDVDMMTGKNAGVMTVGVTWGFRSREELSSHFPDCIVDSPAGLLPLFLDSNTSCQA